MSRFHVHIALGCLLAAAAWSATLDTDLRGRPVKRGFFSSAKCKIFGSGCGPSEDDLTYGVLFDAGSSSTKLRVYRVTPSESSGSLPTLAIVYSQRFDPGVDSFVNDEDGLREYLTSILDSAKENVPENKQERTPIYLFATAGMRFLSADDATALVDNIKEVFQNSSLSPFLYKPAGVGILSGEEEGVYSWVAANYLLGFFNENRPDTEAVGVLEMGGGSTQITFVPRNPLYDGEFQVTVRGRTFELYVHSYLQFGINAINNWVAQILAERNPRQRFVHNPCMLKGDEKEVKLQNGLELTMDGSSDPDQCKDILTTILKPETGIRCEPKPCAIGSVYQPDVDDIQFYATQGFTYAPATLNAIEDDETLNLETLEENASRHCRRTLKQSVKAGIKRDLGSTTCLMGEYIPILFTTSYNFPTDTTNIKATSNIGDSSIDWGLGAMVIELTGNQVRRRRR
ncbi:unnamed protein product [Candidula unifasciata]|uniref:Uncharacterized protein n=1 Tax=Candidula unifasciata TaxID=100452 RepID=A0A8S3YU48_9EUPU|nr:unnamed protein product [Candidula unifasciata]